MFGISFAELFLIAVLILVFVGPDRLPEAARWAGKGLRELRKASNTLRDALLLDELDELRKPGSRRRKESPQRLSAPPSTTPPKEPVPKQFPSASPGLDQLDDDHFDRLLEQEYHFHHNQLARIPLEPWLRTPALSFAELADQSSGEWAAVEIVASRELTA